MSTWNLGIGDVSDETRAFKDKLTSKDAQIAAQRDRLVKQAADYDELEERLNEALHKLTCETQRALRLESDLQQRSEDLRNEQMASENIKSTLATALDNKKQTTLEMRQLESTLERISHTSDEHNARGAKLEREKKMLEMRVREMEANLRELAQPIPTTTPSRRVTTARGRSSSLSNFRITTLEQDLVETRASLAKKDTDLHALSQKLLQVQGDLIKIDNEKVAMERKSSSQVEKLQASLEEKEEELGYLREQQGDGSREEALLRRIDEDDAKIAALELMLRGAEDSQQIKERARRLEAQLKEEQRRRAATEENQVELVREKEEALDELQGCRREQYRLTMELNETKARTHAIGQKAVKSLETCDDPLMNDDSCLIDMETLEPQFTSSPTPTITSHPETDADTITQIERLLLAIDRLRGERDNLRRNVQFLESESRFAIEALEAKLSASMSTASNYTMATVEQLKAQIDEMHAQNAVVDRAKAGEIRRLQLHVQGLAIALGRLTSEQETSRSEWSQKTHNELMSSQATLEESQTIVKELEQRYNVTVLCLETVTSQRDDLLKQLQTKDAEWEQETEALRMAEHAARERLEEFEGEMSDFSHHIEELESDRDSLALQVTNLTTDLQIAQEELTNAETRYTNLQFHQLSSMTNNEATRTLRDHIEELEMRVMRRTEQIGIHQHDIRRLETNLRLQEERLGEMTVELEMMAAQKDAMVEDCADAREARDEAIGRVEALEEEMEAVEGRNDENMALVTHLIAVIAETVARAREAIGQAKSQATGAKHDLVLTQQQQATLQQELDEKLASLLDLTKQSDEHYEELQKVRLALVQCQTEAKELSTLAQILQEEKVALESQIASLKEQAHESIILDLQNKNKDLQSRIEEKERAGATNDEAKRVLAQVKLQHAEAIDQLRGQLVETESKLEELQSRYKSSEGDHQRAIEEAKSSMQQLEQRLETTTKSLAELTQTHGQVDALEKEHAKRILELQDHLDRTSEAQQEALKSRDVLHTENVRLAHDMDQLLKEKEGLLARSLDDKVAIQQESEKKVQSLQGRLEEETRLLQISKEEATQLELRLQDETGGRAQDQKAHEEELLSAKKKYEQAEESISQLRAELNSVQKNLETNQGYLAAAEEEKTILQQDITTFEAEVQKSKSLSRYLEAQIKDSDQLVTTLKTDLERLRADLGRSEKACKAAEVNLSLQNAQHKRESSEIRRELSILRSRPNLEQALAELEERNNEMEDLLRAKCTEIEENDDRVLEMLKEKKKLTTKVESLNRKVQNLQAKLAAAKASSTPVAPPVTETRATPPPISAITPVAPQTFSSTSTFSRPRSVTVASAPPALPRSFVDMQMPSSSTTRKTPSNRVVSGPSSLSRPKTPERPKTITPVFRARTPERRHYVDVDPMPCPVVIGKKRSAPDDFEVCENMPAQAFTPDAEDVENRTPRVRRVLNSLQSFTPVRNQNSRPTVPMPSPRRTGPSRTSPFISDMTNSPHFVPPMPTSTAKQSNKRSWLGKIRGTSQPAEKHSGMRGLFDRGEPS